MNLTDAPAYTPIPFANAGTKNAIPATATGGAASFTSGFPAPTFQPISSGGIPPEGADFNGILYTLSYSMRWTQAGGTYGWNSTFSTGITGYPKGALIQRADGNGYWMNLVDGNTTNPDTGGANWTAVRANTGTSTIAMVAGNNTPTADKLAAETLLLTGSLATAGTLVLPLTAGANWIVANNTTGAGALNVQGSTGASVVVPQGSAIQVYSDGVGFYAIAAPTTGAYLPLHGTADAATVLATSRNFSISGLATAAAVAFNGGADVVLSVTTLNVPSALGYTPANDANVVHKTGNETIAGIKTFSSAAVFSSTVSTQAFTCTTFNASSSDRRLKHDIRKAQPLPLHRLVRYVSFIRNVDGSKGRGVIAQSLVKHRPEYVGSFEFAGKKRLSVDMPSLAYEQAVWASQEVDRLTKRVTKLERSLARAKIEPRKRGFVRRVLEAIW